MSEDGDENTLRKKSGVAESKLHDAVFHDLMHECKHSAPGARLSAKLRTSLERLPPAARRAVVSRLRDGCAPLFVACQRGNVELVEYLVHVCAARLEQRGIYEVPHDHTTHSVTPLWCAAVSGRLAVLRALADAGADLNGSSDSGSTPVRSACFMTHIDVVKFLVERGADMHRANHNGGTCLINSVQSVPLCSFLLAHGAAVDARDTQHKTALHYAIQEHRLETARLLLDRGADPLLVSRGGDDALRTACLRGAAQILSLLLTRVRYPLSRIADAYELIGATQLDEFNDIAATMVSWRRATDIRHAHGDYIEKTWADTLEPPGRARELLFGEAAEAALEAVPEWRTASELAELELDMDALRGQALRVVARVAGPTHRDTVFRLMYRGAAYADSLDFTRCIELWTWALELRLEADTVLHPDTCQTASALTRLLLDSSAAREARDARAAHSRTMRVLALLADALPGARAALRPRPVHRRQADTFDRALRCVSHLLLALLRTSDAEPYCGELRRRVRALVAADVRSALTGDSLLHLSVSRLNVVQATYFGPEPDPEPEPERAFPSAAVARLLLECGADPTARNGARASPLHVACAPYNYSEPLLLALLAGGAHFDQPNRFGDSAATLAPLQREGRLRPLQHTSLACLAARALLLLPRAQQPAPAALPPSLREFLDLHRP